MKVGRRMDGFREFELSILDGIRETMSTPFFDKFWVFITILGDHGLLWIILALALTIYPKTRKVGLMCCLSLVFSGLLTNIILKNLVGRIRPYYYRDIVLLISEPSEYSFPSGHTCISFSLAFVLLKNRFEIGIMNLYIPALVLAGLIAFSRMYLYVHFPSDIIGGVLVAYVCSLLAFIVSKKVIRIIEKKQQSA